MVKGQYPTVVFCNLKYTYEIKYFESLIKVNAMDNLIINTS